MQKVNRVGVFLAKNGDQHIGAIDFLFARGLNMQNRPLDDALKTERRLRIDIVISRNGGGVLRNKGHQFAAQGFDVGAAGPQRLCGRWVVNQRQQQVLHRDEFMAFLPCFDKGHVQTDFKFLGDHPFSSITQTSGCWCSRA